MIVFTAADMPIEDANTTYFYLFPGKKRFVKRCMGKPGDTLYFYGGRIYGIDTSSQPISTLSDPQFLGRYGLSHLESIPTITFEGRVSLSERSLDGAYHHALYRQMGLEVGQITLNRSGEAKGQFFAEGSWHDDEVNALKTAHATPKSYSDLWGIGNYAAARLLTREEALAFTERLPNYASNAKLYLELKHTPSFSTPSPQIRLDSSGKMAPTLTPFTTLLPLTEVELQTLLKTMNTSRFIVREGRVYNYQKGRSSPKPNQLTPTLAHIPDGSYEFEQGRAYKVHFGGFRSLLPPTHPLYSTSPEHIQKLFNLGIIWNKLFQPYASNQPYNPPRYAYFREGALYLMGQPLFTQESSLLTQFVQQEIQREEASSATRPYIAFVDHGAPLTAEGNLDIEKIKAFGLRVPQTHLLALGDNHPMSADSRDFGFVPVENLRGTPSFIFWPFGSRWGAMAQPPYPWLTLPHLIIWSLLLLTLIFFLVSAYKSRKRRYFD